MANDMCMLNQQASYLHSLKKKASYLLIDLGTCRNGCQGAQSCTGACSYIELVKRNYVIHCRNGTQQWYLRSYCQNREGPRLGQRSASY